MATGTAGRVRRLASHARKRVTRLFTAGPAAHFDAAIAVVGQPLQPHQLYRLTRLAMNRSRHVRLDRQARSAAVARSRAGREQAVATATHGRWTHTDLRDALALPAPQRRRVWSSLGWFESITLAWLLCVQNLDPDDRTLAVTLYDHARELRPSRSFPSRHQRIYLEALLATGQHDRALAGTQGSLGRTIPGMMIAADARNPWTGAGRESDQSEWLASVNALFARDGVEPVAVRDEPDAVAFDRLHSEPATQIAEGATVTVVVSAFRPDHRLLAAVASVCASSWSNLDIAVYDDASGPEYEPVLAAVERVDARVRVVRMPRNGGTYAIRNHALDHARGTFITFHDSDDWMHPRRIELQVVHLLSHDAVLANASRSARVTEHLAFSHSRNLGAQICEPSLMLRRERALARVGYFDTVRKAADAEYRLRMETTHGPTEVIGQAPLTLQLVLAQSLSNTDIMRHWFHPDRRIYRSCFEHWHAQQAAGEGTVQLSPGSADPRPFYAPASLTGAAPNERPDVVVASNWLELGTWGEVDTVVWEITTALVAHGLRVAIADQPQGAPLYSMRWALAPHVSAMLNAGSLTYVGPDYDGAQSVVVTRRAHAWAGEPHPASASITVEVPHSGKRDAIVSAVTRHVIEACAQRPQG